jgi:hypothetical protein
VALLLVALLIIYDPVRDNVSRGVIMKPSAEVSSVAHLARDRTAYTAAVAREQVRSHSELAFFAFAAVVLFGFMLRT